GQARGPRGARREEGQVERPRTDERGVSEEGRPQAALEPDVPTVPDEVAQAPDTTTQKQMHDDPTKLDQSGRPAEEKSRGEGAGGRGSKGGRT
ncbi:MAG: hypothetical protein M3123_07310, partial [Actinomycetota bacterium]|nr:hypothetical protein [Actinomycetota bacterium]